MMGSMRKINYEKIDYEIRDLIRDLNEHGYTTDYCCSGHEEEDYWYVSFREMPIKAETDATYFFMVVKEDIHWDTDKETQDYLPWKFQIQINFYFDEYTHRWFRRIRIGSHTKVSRKEREYHWKMIRAALIRNEEEE